MKEIRIKNLSFGIKDKEILHDIDVTLPADRFVALLGPNGCGKSTLLKHLYRVNKIQKGAIAFDGSPLADIPLREAAQSVGVMGQFHLVDFDFTVEEIAMMGRAPYKENFEKDTEEDYVLVHASLAKVGMAEQAKRSFQVSASSAATRQVARRRRHSRAA